MHQAPNPSGLSLEGKLSSFAKGIAAVSANSHADSQSSADHRRRQQQQQQQPPQQKKEEHQHRRRPRDDKAANSSAKCNDKFSSHSRCFVQKQYSVESPMFCNSLSTFIFIMLIFWSLTPCPTVLGQQQQQQHQQQQQQNEHKNCPGCPQHAHFNRDKVSEKQEQFMRLEAIKHQILEKLGLSKPPNVNKTLALVPKRLALETIYRAEAQPAMNPELERSRHHNNNYHSNRADAYDEFDYEANDKYSYRNLDGKESENQNVPPYQDYDDIYRSPEPDVVDDFYARTSEIITFAEPGRTLNNQPLLDFPLSSSEPALEPLSIKKAVLWARVELKHAHRYQLHRHNLKNYRNITLWVFRVRCGNLSHLRGKELSQHLEMVTSLVVNIGQLGWQKFDVTRVVSNWYQQLNNKDKLTLLVDCTGCGSHVHVSTFGGHSPHVIEPSLNSKSPQDPDRPFLVVRTDPKALKRVRRRAVECHSASKNQCCKERFYVSFVQLGWDDWIIAPEGYYANFCRGDCSQGHRTPDTFPNYYTHVMEEYRKMDRLIGMQPCCAPLKFSSISLIYYGPDSNIIKRDLPKMVVDECGCP